MLAEILEKAQKDHMVKLCVVGNWIHNLDKVDQEAVDKAMSHRILPSTELMKILKDAGAPFKLTALKSHRSGDCVCQN